MELSARDRTLTLVGIIMAMFLGALDQTIVATALPRIVEDLQALSRYAWVATAYLLASTVLVPIYGKLADMVSRKSIELFSVWTFLLGSVLCGAAGQFGTLPLLGDGMNQLIAFRALQGIGGAGLFTMAFIIIADLFPARERGKYQGFVGAAFGIASVLGPYVGGLLTDHAGGIIPGVAGWRWVFYVNVPFGAVALWFITTRMPPLLPGGERGRLDLLSAGLLIVALVPLVLALQLDKARFPWGDPVTLSLLAGSFAGGALFVWRSLASSSPVLDLRLFRNRVFTTANLAGFLLGGAFLSTVIFLPLYMVNVLGVSATGAGLSLIPLSLGTAIGAIGSGQLASRLGRYKPIMVVSVATFLLAMWLLSTVGVDTPYGLVTFYMLVAGFGVGPGLPLYTLAIQNAVAPGAVGQATSASQFFRQIGGAVGAALMGTLLATSLATSFAALPAAGMLDAAAFGSELRQTGGANVGEEIRTATGAQADIAASAALAGDEPALAAALLGAGLPSDVREHALQRAVAAAGDASARTRLAEEVRTLLNERGEAVASETSAGVRRAFADAIAAIFGALTWVVLAGGLVTVMVPSLELAGRRVPVRSAT